MNYNVVYFVSSVFALVASLALLPLMLVAVSLEIILQIFGFNINELVINVVLGSGYVAAYALAALSYLYMILCLTHTKTASGQPARVSLLWLTRVGAGLLVAGAFASAFAMLLYRTPIASPLASWVITRSIPEAIYALCVIIYLVITNEVLVRMNNHEWVIGLYSSFTKYLLVSVATFMTLYVARHVFILNNYNIVDRGVLVLEAASLYGIAISVLGSVWILIAVGLSYIKHNSRPIQQ